MATAFWAPKETKPEAPHETLFTTLLHPAPIKTLSTSIFCIIWVDSPVDSSVTTEKEELQWDDGANIMVFLDSVNFDSR